MLNKSNRKEGENMTTFHSALHDAVVFVALIIGTPALVGCVLLGPKRFFRLCKHKIY